MLQIKASFGINHFQVKYFDEDNEEVRGRRGGGGVYTKAYSNSKILTISELALNPLT